MRQAPPNNGRRPRGRHHGGGHNGGGHNGGGHSGGGGGGGNVSMRGGGIDNRPRSAAALRHQTFDSNCIDLRVRGNAWQVHEKYQALARDAQSAGDRVAAENYLQHAEHYFRIIEAINDATAQEQRARGITPGAPFNGQPETPNNYYGADGVPPVTAQHGNGVHGDAAMNVPPVNGNGQQEQQVQTEAQVRRPTPPPNPFFTPEEMDQQNEGPQSLVAQR